MRSSALPFFVLMMALRTYGLHWLNIQGTHRPPRAPGLPLYDNTHSVHEFTRTTHKVNYPIKYDFFHICAQSI